MSEPICCTPKRLPDDQTVAASAIAISHNPLNGARLRGLVRLMPEFVPTIERIAVVTEKYWGPAGVKLTVGFMEQTAAELRDKIIAHMNAWNQYGNVTFVYSTTSPQVRISRGSGGYWSYLGTDILSIPANQQTMNLEGFTLNTPDSEYKRVVRHETGHTLGFPHEHLRADLVAAIDPQKAIAYFRQTQGWSAQEVQAQVLTPLDDRDLIETPHSDQMSIMCYQLPGSIMKSGQPIVGGSDIDPTDQGFVNQIYPKAVVPPVNPPPVNPPPVNPPSPPAGSILPSTTLAQFASWLYSHRS